jgi:hypothetical protein
MRLLVSAGLIAVLLLSACSLFAQRTYFGQQLDPDAPSVVPLPGPDAAVLATQVDPPDAIPPGVEGSVLFIRLTDPAGHRILDRPFTWSKDEQRIPPGTYALSAYLMVCDANCGNLDGESPAFCKADITALPGRRIEVTVTPRSLSPGTTCTVTRDF